LLFIATLFLVAPFLFVISASLKSSTSLFQDSLRLIPETLYLGNYEQLLFHTEFPRWMFNTLFVACVVMSVKLVIDSMAAYAFAKLRFRGKSILFLLVMASLMIPDGAIIVPLWAIVHGLGLLNSYPGLILPALAGPLGVFFMRAFIGGLPKDLDNAARLDGASEFGIYREIVLPLVKPGLVVLAVVLFTQQYLSLLWPLIAAQNSDLQLLTVGIVKMSAQLQVNYAMWSAASVMAMVPIGIFFFFLQRQFLARSVAGAFK
jgi:ABC-type glycerol-3-phosphate transport system permease component